MEIFIVLPVVATITWFLGLIGTTVVKTIIQHRKEQRIGKP